MIRYRDFVPKSVKTSWFGDELYGTFDAAVEAANAWMAAESVDVVSMETVALPNIFSPSEEGSADGSLGTASGWATWHQFVRVWYRET